jgi:hypothetical protein
MEIRPTALNVLQLAFSPATAARNARLGAVRDFARGRPLLPWPYDLLKEVGRAIVEGRPGFFTQQSGLEWVAQDLPPATDPGVVEAQRVLKAMDAAFDEAHANNRAMVRDFLKARGLSARWTSAPQFLEDQWTRVDQVDTLAEGMWRALRLPGAAPVAEMLTSEAWRLLLEAFGAAVFGRVVASQQTRRVQLSDYLQLVYLGGTPRRILVSDDKAFVSIASAVVNGRYAGAYLYSWSDFISRQ